MGPEQLDRALQMLTRECAGKSFGIDLIIPEQYVGREEGGLSLEALQSRIPQGHRDFLDQLLISRDSSVTSPFPVVMLL